jgi:urea transport system permease protein
MWLFLMAALFIGVTMAFPMGLAGVWEERIKPWWKQRRQALRDAEVKAPETVAARATNAAATTADKPALPEGVSPQSV